VPLILSTGAGAEARHALGWIVVGGLGFATLFTLFLTPVAYLLFARFSKTRSAESERLEAELAETISGESSWESQLEATPEARPAYRIAAE
jgi:HAE1 family hydrophobic/amphiphilic exporter-1